MADELPQQTEGTTTQPEQPSGEGLDINDAVANIAESLHLTEAPPEAEDEKPAEPATAEDDKGEKPTAETEKPAEPEPTVGDAPPDTWRKEAKEAWAGIPPVVKEEMRKRESDIAKYVETSKVPISVGEQFSKIVEPYLPRFQQANVNVWDNVAAMFKAQELLLFGSPETKLAMLSSLAQQAGVKLEGGQLQPASDQQATYIRQLEQRINNLEGGVKNVASTVQEARLQELEAGVLQFAQDTEKHPFFNDVANEIAHFISTGAAKSLDEAYNLAVMANPAAKQKYIDAQTAQAVAKRDAEEAEKVAKARKASRANVRTTTRGRAEQPLGDIDSTLKETLADINSRH